jgi:hypothetical protein
MIDGIEPELLTGVLSRAMMAGPMRRQTFGSCH